MECIDLTLDDNTGPRAAATAGSEDVVCIEIDSQEKDAYAEECRTKAPSVVNCSGTVGKERILRSVAQREEIMAETKAKLARVAQIRRELERSDSCFSDEDFPADASSIDGRNKLSSAVPDPAVRQQRKQPLCPACGSKAVAKKVFKEGRNHGKYFWSCPNRLTRQQHSPSTTAPRKPGCDRFFEWASWVPHRAADAELEWRRCGPPVYSFVSSRGKSSSSKRGNVSAFKSADVQQGSVGNCWFLSAVAIVAEREDLMFRIFPTETRNASKAGIYAVNLFIDGAWQTFVVDSYLPCKKHDKDGGPARVRRRDMGSIISGASDRNRLFPLAFAKATRNQLWVPLLEKAYAKAHRSYGATSGGWVAEALWDLTGCPTETISIGGRIGGTGCWTTTVRRDCLLEGDADAWSAEQLWARLLSYCSSGFVMGCSTSRSGKGVVGGHAYSLLDVREVGHAVVGEQPRITTFLRSSTSPIKKRSLLRSCKAGEPRLKQPRMGRQTQMLLPSRERTLPALFSAVVSSGWVCSLCTFKNHGKEKRGALKCAMCQSVQPSKHDTGEETSNRNTSHSCTDSDVSHWTCKRCTFCHTHENDGTLSSCRMCGVLRNPARSPTSIDSEVATAERAAERRAHEVSSGLTNAGTLRMLKIRNPWGHKEWSGDWSSKSQQWTRRLQKVLGNTTANDGTFWMAFDDFLAHFTQIEVAKTHRDWNAVTVPGIRISAGNFCPSGSGAYVLSLKQTTWLYYSLIQRTTRGRRGSKSMYHGLGVLILRCRVDSNGAVEVVGHHSWHGFGPTRVSHVELLLNATTEGECYLFVPCRTDGTAQRLAQVVHFSIRIFSAQPVEMNPLSVSSNEFAKSLHLTLNNGLLTSNSGAKPHGLGQKVNSSSGMFVIEGRESTSTRAALSCPTMSAALKVHVVQGDSCAIVVVQNMNSHTAVEVSPVLEDFPIDLVSDSDLVRFNSARTSRTSVIHLGVTCDVCGMNPIIGCRYKRDFRNYDLCENDFRKLSAREQLGFKLVERSASVTSHRWTRLAPRERKIVELYSSTQSAHNACGARLQQLRVRRATIDARNPHEAGHTIYDAF